MLRYGDGKVGGCLRERRLRGRILEVWGRAGRRMSLGGCEAVDEKGYGMKEERRCGYRIRGGGRRDL